MLRFVMYLAFKLGKTLAEIGTMDLEELSLWVAFIDRDDPDRRADWLAGMQAAVTANCHNPGENFRPGDFVPSLDEGQEFGEDVLKEHLKGWVMACGGTINPPIKVTR